MCIENLSLLFERIEKIAPLHTNPIDKDFLEKININQLAVTHTLYPLSGADAALPFALFKNCRRLVCIDKNKLIFTGTLLTSLLNEKLLLNLTEMISERLETREKFFSFDGTNMYNLLGQSYFPEINQLDSAQKYSLLPAILIQLRLLLGAHHFVYQQNDHDMETLTFYSADNHQYQINFCHLEISREALNRLPLLETRLAYLGLTKKNFEAVIIKASQSVPYNPAYQKIIFEGLAQETIFLSDLSHPGENELFYAPSEKPTQFMHITFGYSFLHVFKAKSLKYYLTPVNDDEKRAFNLLEQHKKH